MSSNRPKVLHVINDVKYWLAHREKLGAAAKSAGFNVAVAAPDSEDASRLTELGYEFHPLPLTRFRLNLQDICLIATLARLVRREHFDVVHLMTIKPILFGGLVLRLMKAKQRPKVIATVAGLGRGFALKNLAFALLRTSLAFGVGKVAKTVTFENPDDAERYVAERIIQSGQVVVLKGAGIDLVEYQPNPARPDQPIRVLFASRLLHSKGIMAFAEAARRLKAAYGDATEFQVAGMAAIHEKDGLTDAEMRGLQRDPCLNWLGAVPSHLMPAVMSNAHIFVLPTSYPEGLPRCLLEAGACGATVIAGNVPGTRFLINTGTDGILLKHCDPVSVTEAIQQLIDDAPLRHLMAEALRQKIQANGYSIEAINSALIRLYAA